MRTKLFSVFNATTAQIVVQNIPSALVGHMRALQLALNVRENAFSVAEKNGDIIAEYRTRETNGDRTSYIVISPDTNEGIYPAMYRIAHTDILNVFPAIALLNAETPFQDSQYRLVRLADGMMLEMTHPGAMSAHLERVAGNGMDLALLVYAEEMDPEEE